MVVYLSAFDIRDEIKFGIHEFEMALQERNIGLVRLAAFEAEEIRDSDIRVVVGPISDCRIKDIVEANELEQYITIEESLLCHWCRTRIGKILLFSGHDATGVMYILLEMARKLRLYGEDVLTNVENYSEKPDNRIRCMDRYIVGHLDNEWFLNDGFWDAYLSKLAYARYNRFCLIVGFDTAYMAPPYPFFLPPLTEYPEVRALRLTKKDVETNLKQLKTIGKKCHERGIKFVFATWQQRPWTEEQDQLVENLPEEEGELSDYCYKGLKELLCKVEEIDVVQFRVNLESGVGTETSAERFWNHCVDAVADAGKQVGKKFIIDLRAKGLTEDMVTHAFTDDLEVEVPTKYWCEHVALPYHIPAMRSEELAKLDNYNHSRRYSYADMLKKPKRYSVIFRLWNYGTTDLFLWGDADYARRFAKSCMVGGAAGYQVNAPLSLKYGHELSHKERWSIYNDETMRYGRMEEDRFWNWYTIFGRLGYNTEANSEVWKSEFQVHFGTGAEAAEKALSIASKILPLITTVHMPVHPSLRYWPEMNTGWAIFEENNMEASEAYDYYTHLTYGSTEPSDHQLFYGINEYVWDQKRNSLKGKYTPFQYSGWLWKLADETEKALHQFDKTCSVEADQAEVAAFCVDLKMLINISRYHATKILAALYVEASRVNGIDEYLVYARNYMEKAAENWHELSERGEKYYYKDLNFSSAGSLSRRGNWKDREKEVQDDLTTLKILSDKVSVTTEEKKMGQMPDLFEVNLPDVIEEGKGVLISVEIDLRPSEVLKLHYRHMDQTEGMFREITFNKKKNRIYEAEIPMEYITRDFDLMVYISRTSEFGCRIFPGVYNDIFPYPYHIIEVKG